MGSDLSLRHMVNQQFRGPGAHVSLQAAVQPVCAEFSAFCWLARDPASLLAAVPCQKPPPMVLGGQGPGEPSCAGLTVSFSS